MILKNTKPILLKRIWATLIDYGLYFLIVYTYMMFFGEMKSDGSQEVTGLLILPIVIFWFFYFVFLEGFFSYSATLGHQLFYLRTVQINGRQIDVEHSLKRHLLDPIDLFIFGIPGIIAIQSTDKNQRLGDLWAKTTVIKIPKSQNKSVGNDLPPI